MESFLRSIGVTDEVVNNLDKVSLAFQRPMVLWVSLILLIPAGYFIYRRQRENLATIPKKYRVALSVTRILILAVLLGVLSGPYLKLDHREQRKPILAVLLDQSQSMRLPAGPFLSNEKLVKVATAAGYATTDGKVAPETRKALNRIARSELAQTVIKSAQPQLIEPLGDEFEIRYYGFSRQVTPVSITADDSEQAAEEGVTGIGNASHLGDAIFHVLDDAAGQYVSGILLLSDGQNTGGRSPSLAARAAAAAESRIFAAPLGSSQPMQDVSIVDVYTSGQVAVGDMVSVHVTLASQGFDNRPVKVNLKEGDEVLASKEAVVRDSEHQHLELTFEAKQAGERLLTVDVPPLKEEDEALHANNTDSAFVQISEEKLRVLLIDGFPRWDFRFIKNAIRRDHGLAGRKGEQPEVVVETEWRRLPTPAQQAALPRTLEELAEYDTIMIGDASPAMLTPEFCDLLAKGVEEEGVGLIVSAGTESMPHRYGPVVQHLLPVVLSAGNRGIEAPVYDPFRLEVTPAGIIHETMRLYDDPGRNQNVWREMPDYFWCAAVDRLQPAATALAVNPIREEGGIREMPLIAWHYAGDGKVMFVGTDSTWLWRQNVGDRFFYKFWGQALRFVSRQDDQASQKTQFKVRPVRAQPGEEAQLELLAFSPSGAPLKGAQQKVLLLSPGTRETLTLESDPNREGRYTGNFTPRDAGKHRLVFSPPDGSETVETSLQVLIAPEEYRNPNVNRPQLELLASTTGGQIVDLDELDTIPEQLEKRAPEERQLHREATLWDNWLILLILVLTYTLDVGIRRLMGLS
ncbi:MAG: hypothetical protein CMJ59_17630 [Planctomycetaceae bacterium]|nr:hypothetical protein [Planctomycetaceae bacterium]